MSCIDPLPAPPPHIHKMIGLNLRLTEIASIINRIHWSITPRHLPLPHHLPVAFSVVYLLFRILSAGCLLASYPRNHVDYFDLLTDSLSRRTTAGLVLYCNRLFHQTILTFLSYIYAFPEHSLQ